MCHLFVYLYSYLVGREEGVGLGSNGLRSLFIWDQNIAYAKRALKKQTNKNRPPHETKQQSVYAFRVQ